MRVLFIVCSSLDARENTKNEDHDIGRNIQWKNIQIEEDDNGRLRFVVNLLERIFSIECLTSDAAAAVVVVVGFVSIE